MMQRHWTLVSGFVVLSALGIVACSSADTPEGDDEGTGGSSGSATGGSATGGTSSGGTSSGGTSTGGSTATGGTGGTDAPNPDPECKGIRTNMMCTLEGKMCPNMACGIADSGRRDCNCATNWSCASCNYDNSPFRDRPDPMPPCPAEAADEVPCTSMNAVCGPVGSEYCACYQDAQDGLIWDCDSPPTTWGM